MSVDDVKTPVVKWAQRKDSVYVTVEVTGACIPRNIVRGNLRAVFAFASRALSRCGGRGGSVSF